MPGEDENVLTTYQVNVVWCHFPESYGIGTPVGKLIFQNGGIVLETIFFKHKAHL
jgi:hypothetical protein